MVLTNKERARLFRAKQKKDRGPPMTALERKQKQRQKEAKIRALECDNTLIKLCEECVVYSNNSYQIKNEKIIWETALKSSMSENEDGEHDEYTLIDKIRNGPVGNEKVNGVLKQILDGQRREKLVAMELERRRKNAIIEKKLAKCDNADERMELRFQYNGYVIIDID